MNVRPFRTSDLTRIRLQPGQLGNLSFVTPEYGQRLIAAGPSITVERNEVVLGCAGIGIHAGGSGVLWAFIAGSAGKHFVAIDRIARRFIGTVPLRRLEATVEKGFEPGCRWLDLLGFHFEGEMRSYGPDGLDHLRYARVRI